MTRQPLLLCLVSLLLASTLIITSCTNRAQPPSTPIDQRSFTLTFVGTGGPEITVDREGIATLVRAGGRTILVDAGRNVMQNLYEAGFDPRNVTDIMLTHLHNDHIEGLPTLWMTGWFLLGRTEPLTVWGPEGTAAMIEGMYSMYEFDITHRSNKFNNKNHLLIKVHEIEGQHTITETTDLKIEAFPVEHDDGDPAFAYAFESHGYKAFLTGDTRLFDQLPLHAQGSDVLVSNVLSMPEELASAPEMQGVVAKLMTIQEAAELFITVKPRMAVYSHFVGKNLPKDSDRFIEAKTREAGYRSNLFLAKDGWSIDVHTLELIPPPPADSLPHLDRKKSYQIKEQ